MLLIKARGVSRGQKIKFLIFCWWSTLIEVGLVEPKLAAKEIALTQKMRFTFSIEI